MDLCQQVVSLALHVVTFRQELVNPLMLLRFLPEIVVWICDTLDNNLRIENDFTKIFEVELLEMFCLTFFNQIFF